MISREEAIKELEQLKQTFYDLDICNTATSALCMAIEALSTERPKGRWVRRRKHYGECPECGEIISKLHNYCSNCGLEIVRGEEE